MALTLKQIQLALGNIRERINKEEERHRNRMEQLKQERQALLNAQEVALAGLDLDKVNAGRQVVRVRGRIADGTSTRNGIVRDAMQNIADGCERLRSEFFGCKNYDRWQDQRCDCTYGYGPRHGSIVFSVGLWDEARKRDLNDDEVEAALYYLGNIEEAQRAEAKAVSQQDG